MPPLLFYVAFGHVEAYPEGHPAWMWHTFVTSFPPFHLPQFAIGIAAGLLFVRGALPPARSRPWLLAAASVAIAVVMAVPRALPYGLVNNGLLAPLFVAAIALLSCTRGPAARLLSWGPLLVLGEASYAVYILQQPVHEYAKGLAEALGLADPDASGWFTLAYVLVLVAVSVAVYEWLEVPARRWVRARLGAGRPVRRAGLS